MSVMKRIRDQRSEGVNVESRYAVLLGLRPQEIAAMAKVELKSATIIAQHPHCTVVRVECRYDGFWYRADTEIAEGNTVPNTVLLGSTVEPSDEFILALHEALTDYQDGELYAAEMRRICQ